MTYCLKAGLHALACLCVLLVVLIPSVSLACACCAEPYWYRENVELMPYEMAELARLTPGGRWEARFGSGDPAFAGFALINLDYNSRSGPVLGGRPGSRRTEEWNDRFDIQHSRKALVWKAIENLRKMVLTNWHDTRLASAPGHRAIVGLL